MLPDYPKVKSEFSAPLLEFLEARVKHHLGPLGEIQRVRFFEGDSYRVTRSSGEEEPGEFREIQSVITIRDSELPMMTLESLLRKLDEAAQEMARQMAEGIYASIAEATEKVGNVVDAGGERLTAQTILDTFTKLQIDFNRDGTPRMPQMHIHPSLSDAVRLAGEELDKDPELKRQFRELLEKKRGEWRVREASRKLVG